MEPREFAKRTQRQICPKAFYAIIETLFGKPWRIKFYDEQGKDLIWRSLAGDECQMKTEQLVVKF